MVQCYSTYLVFWLQCVLLVAMWFIVDVHKYPHLHTHTCILPSVHHLAANLWRQVTKQLCEQTESLSAQRGGPILLTSTCRLNPINTHTFGTMQPLTLSLDLSSVQCPHNWSISVFCPYNVRLYRLLRQDTGVKYYEWQKQPTQEKAVRVEGIGEKNVHRLVILELTCQQLMVMCHNVCSAFLIISPWPCLLFVTFCHWSQHISCHEDWTSRRVLTAGNYSTSIKTHFSMSLRFEAPQ